MIANLITAIVSDVMAVVGLSDLSWGVAIVGTGFFVVGLALEELGKYLSTLTKLRAGQIFLVWPCVVIGYAFMGIAALIIILNMFSPIVAPLWRLLFSN
jgi:hypothetical protein